MGKILSLFGSDLRNGVSGVVAFLHYEPILTIVLFGLIGAVAGIITYDLAYMWFVAPPIIYFTARHIRNYYRSLKKRAGVE